MARKKYFANADNTITNAFKANLKTRATDANMGASDVLEVFSIYGQASSGSTELSRILINFPITDISSSRTSGQIPESGSTKFYLNLFNAKTNKTVPRHMYLSIFAVSRSWQEGTGLDMEEYKDAVTQGDIGSNWLSASSTEAWTRMGGDYHASPFYTKYFDTGIEDMSIDVTSLVEEWLSGTKESYGFGIHLSASQEAYYSGSSGADGSKGQLNNLDGSKTTYYDKKFFGRGSEFFFKRPTLEARWNSSVKDDRGQFYSYSNLLSTEENKNTLYLYNIHNGRFKDLPSIGTGSDVLTVRVFTSSSEGTMLDTSPTTASAGRISRGIYTASFSVTTTASVGFDRWYNPLLSEVYYTGSFNIKTRSASGYSPYPNYVTSLTNLRPNYYTHETARFRFYVRQKDWSPTIYTVATTETDTLTIESSSYQIHRLIDDMVVVPFDTGSVKSTEMSYDVSGNYFDLRMDLLEPGYAYGIKISYYDDTVKSYVEQEPVWKFRVEKLETQ